MFARLRLTTLALACATFALAPVALAASGAPTSSPALNKGLGSTAPGRVIDFSGYQWGVRDSGNAVQGPGDNRWSSSERNVFLDGSGRLHLAITRTGKTWYAGEIVSLKTLGYGTYRWTIDSDVSKLDRNTSLGMFTYDTDPAQNHREIDIEHSRWSRVNYPYSSQFCVQPWGHSDRQNLFELPSAQSYVQEFTWLSNKLTFKIIAGSDPNATPAHEWQFGLTPPTSSAEKTIMNYWLFYSAQPTNRRPNEVIVRSFQFFPLGLPVAYPAIAGVTG